MSDTFSIHHTVEPGADTRVPDSHQDHFSKVYLGFWTYLMTDCLIFTTLFITYAVLHGSTFGGPSSKELFSLSTAFAETMVLLVSSATCGMAVLSAVENRSHRVIPWLIITFLLGATFLSLELHEFTDFVEKGHSWSKSAFLSAFFTLVGTHGLHITVGLLWALVMVGQFAIQGLTRNTFRRLVIFSLFWHFLDLVWIFIFTFVYLMGVL